MKKLIILLSLILIFSGCTKNAKKVDEVKKIKQNIEEIKVPEYVDLNNTKIGLYFEKNRKLELIKEYKTNITSGVDIGIFQVYPKDDDEIVLNTDFGTSFYNSWIQTPNYNNLKIGFNVKYILDSGEEISYNILDYNVIYNEIYNYLYDDYANRYKSLYSHIEEYDYNENTLYTSIKLYGASVERINSKISLTVFTYDGLDDFDENDNYRGNSSYTITICDINKTCN